MPKCVYHISRKRLSKTKSWNSATQNCNYLFLKLFLHEQFGDVCLSWTITCISWGTAWIKNPSSFYSKGLTLFCTLCVSLAFHVVLFLIRFVVIYALFLVKYFWLKPCLCKKVVFLNVCPQITWSVLGLLLVICHILHVMCHVSWHVSFVKCKYFFSSFLTQWLS